MNTNRELLAGRFHARLLALEPESVVDLGCGSGALLAACAAAGVAAIGVEPRPRPELLGRVVAAVAEALPFPDASFERSTIRHALHHFADPRAALGEAWRVAGRGVLVAEPWYDDGLPSQRWGLRADRWLKVMDCRRGMLHHDIHPVRAILEWLPGASEVDIESYLRPSLWRVEDLARERAVSCLGVEVSPAAEAEWAEILGAAGRGEVTLGGTVLVRAEKA